MSEKLYRIKPLEWTTRIVKKMPEYTRLGEIRRHASNVFGEFVLLNLNDCSRWMLDFFGSDIDRYADELCQEFDTEELAKAKAEEIYREKLTLLLEEVEGESERK